MTKNYEVPAGAPHVPKLKVYAYLHIEGSLRYNLTLNSTIEKDRLNCNCCGSADNRDLEAAIHSYCRSSDRSKSFLFESVGHRNHSLGFRRNWRSQHANEGALCHEDGHPRGRGNGCGTCPDQVPAGNSPHDDLNCRSHTDGADS